MREFRLSFLSSDSDQTLQIFFFLDADRNHFHFYRIQGAGARDVAQLIEFCLECMKKPWSPSPAPHKTGMGANACHPSTPDLEAGASEVQGHSPVLNELEARQATGNSILKTSKQIKKNITFQ